VTAPGWLGTAFAALMIVVSVCALGRLAVACARGKHGESDVDALHVLMGVAMAGMFEARLLPLPATTCQAVFAVAGAWFGWQAIRSLRRSKRARPRCTFPAAHTVECTAMIYMLLPNGSQPAGHRPALGMPGMTSAAANPALSLVLALFMLGYIIWTADRFADMSRGSGQLRLQGTHDRGALLAPRLAASYKIAMGIAMSYMLVMML
jgi:hypothetical protein